MSLEDSITTLATAINNLADAVKLNAAPVVTEATESLNVISKNHEPKPETKDVPTPKAENTAKKQETKEPAKAQDPAPEPAAAKPAPAVTMKDIGPFFARLLEAKGTAAGRAIIDHFDKDAKRLTEAVPAGREAECMAMVKAALEA